MEDLRSGYPRTLTDKHPVGTISGFYFFKQTEQLRKEFEIRNTRTAHRPNESELRTIPRNKGGLPHGMNKWRGYSEDGVLLVTVGALVVKPNVEFFKLRKV